MHFATIQINFKDCLVLVSIVSIIAFLFLIYSSHNIEFLDNKTNDCVKHLSTVSTPDSSTNNSTVQNSINLGQNSFIKTNEDNIAKNNEVLTKLETTVTKLQASITSNTTGLAKLKAEEERVKQKLNSIGKNKQIHK
jgi:hypothetical protein|tara:strand:+ start:314 stop:724 length:411 start_codon:yes stop_codon:yes gene_type:complete